jgi:hypothetical protein
VAYAYKLLERLKSGGLQFEIRPGQKKKKKQVFKTPSQRKKSWAWQSTPDITSNSRNHKIGKSSPG